MVQADLSLCWQHIIKQVFLGTQVNLGLSLKHITDKGVLHIEAFLWESCGPFHPVSGKWTVPPSINYVDNSVCCDLKIKIQRLRLFLSQWIVFCFFFQNKLYYLPQKWLPQVNRHHFWGGSSVSVYAALENRVYSKRKEFSLFKRRLVYKNVKKMPQKPSSL